MKYCNFICIEYRLFLKSISTMNIIQFILIVPLFISCNTPQNSMDQKTSMSPDYVQREGLETAYFASGCFWCVEAIYESVRGVDEVINGYSGGHTKNPTYAASNTGRTGHAEAVEVFYDPEIVNFKTLVDVYYGSQDPTTVNGQAPDFGSQYRSIIFYKNEEEKLVAEAAKANLEENGGFSKPIATEIVPFEKFWVGEEYHQDYERRNPNQPYIQRISIPRLKRFQAKFPELLKDEH